MTKKWLVGLGNRGRKYENTRHNVGFSAIIRYIDRFASVETRVHESADKHESEFLSLNHGNTRLYLVRPLTFMNESGRSLQSWKAKEGLDPAQMLVIYDDMDLPLGKVRYRAKGSGGSHNGMASIIECLGTDQFSRLRIGVDKPDNPVEWADYVLRRFTAPEKKALVPVLEKTTDAMKDWADGMSNDRLMSKYNA